MFLDGKTFTCCAFGVNINSSIEHHFVSMLGVCLEKMGTASKKKKLRFFWGIPDPKCFEHSLLGDLFFPFVIAT